MTKIEEQKIQTGLKRLQKESNVNDLLKDIHRSIEKLLKDDQSKNPSKTDKHRSIQHDKKSN